MYRVYSTFNKNNNHNNKLNAQRRQQRLLALLFDFVSLEISFRNHIFALRAYIGLYYGRERAS